MRAWVVAGCVLVLTPLWCLGQSAGDIEGIWLRGDKKNYKVEIYPCGELYCGKIIWLKEPLDENGNPRLDKYNPDPLQRQRPLMGIDVLTGFKFNGESWKGGKIYSFNRGKFYDAQIKLKEDQLQLMVSILFFSKNYNWLKSN